MNKQFSPRPGSIAAQIIEHSLELKVYRRELLKTSVRQMDKIVELNAKIAATTQTIERLELRQRVIEEQLELIDA